MMFEFIRIQYNLGVIDADKVKSFSPKYITEVEVKKILEGN